MLFSWDRHLMPCGSWQHPRGAMHGLANGEIRMNAGKMDVFQTFDGPDTSYPDGLITETALGEIVSAPGMKYYGNTADAIVETIDIVSNRLRTCGDS